LSSGARSPAARIIRVFEESGNYGQKCNDPRRDWIQTQRGRGDYPANTQTLQEKFARRERSSPSLKGAAGARAKRISSLFPPTS